MKAVILCGGKGLRLAGVNSRICKPLIDVGGRPILWHIMKYYQAYGFNEFVLCLGQYSEQIKDYFLNLSWRNNDFRLRADGGVHLFNKTEEWDIIFAETGLETMTGGRIKRIQRYIEGEEFLLTYGDGLADIPLDELLAFHRKQGKLATVTGIRQHSRFGMMKVTSDVASSFLEKPLLEGWINGGFFVLGQQVFDYIGDDNTVWEKEPLQKLVQERQLAVYRHNGFWQSVDTMKDVVMINEQWDKNDRPWVRW